MGTIMKAACGSCGFEKELHTGGGKLDCNIEVIISALPEAEHQALSEAIKLGAIRISINREPCSCVFCKGIYAIPVVSYVLDGEKHSICGVCPSCGKKEYATPRCCPDCGAELSISETGLWD